MPSIHKDTIKISWEYKSLGGKLSIDFKCFCTKLNFPGSFGNTLVDDHEEAYTPLECI